jgi:hypothetical protein
MSDLQVPPGVLSAVQAHLQEGRDALEESAGSAPRTVDAGDLTPMIQGMIAKALDNAASISSGLSAARGQVAEAGTHFWEVDAEQAAGYRPSLVR